MFESDGDENEQNQPIVNGVRTMRDLLENELNEKENMGAREKSHTTHEIDLSKYKTIKTMKVLRAVDLVVAFVGRISE